MNPDAPQLPPDEREARLTALVHGELPAAEAEALRAEIAADAALAALFRRLSRADSLARETVRSPEPKELSKPEPLQLAPERRAALLAKFKAPPANVVRVPDIARKAWADRRELLALAAMLVAVITAAGAMLPALAKAKSKSSRVAALQAARTAELEGRRETELAKRPAVAPSSAAADSAGVLVQDTEFARGEAADAPAKPAAAAPMDPVLAKRYGLAQQDSAADVRTPASASDEVTSPALARENGDSSRRLLREELAVKQQVANGRENNLARGGIVLPAAGAQATWDVSTPPAVDFFGRDAAPVRGQGVGAGGGDTAGTQWFFRQSQVGQGGSDGRSADDVVLFNDQAYTAAGAGGASFGGGSGGRANQLNFGGIAAQTPPPAPVPADVVVPDPATVAFAVPVEGDAKAGELSATTARPAVGRGVETLSRVAGRKDGAPGQSEVGARGGAAPSEPLVAAVGDSTVALARGVNGPVLNSPAALDFREKEVPLQGRKAEVLAEVAAVVPPTEAMDHLETVDGSRAQVALGFAVTRVPAHQADKKSGAEPGVERFAKSKAKADSATGEGELVEELAEREAGQTVALAGKPITTRGYFVELATNAAAPTLGDAPVLGRIFKGAEVARGQVAQAVADTATAPPSLAKEQRDLATLKQLREILATKVAQEEIDSAISKKSSVEMIDEATATPAPDGGLLSKLRTKLGGDATRIARLKVERDTPDIQLLGYASGNQTYDPHFLQTEFERIKSRQVLGKAAAKLNLPATEDTVRKLEGKLSVSQYLNTGIVEIQAKDADPAKAAEIANAVAQAYEEYRNSSRTERNQRGLEVLKLKLEEASKQIAAKERSLAQAAQPVSAPVREPDAPLPKLAPGAPEPQPEVATADNAFSTFSLNVSDVSFKLAAAALEKGQMPEPATVRTEEFINAFDYRDPEPAGTAPIAFAWERARYPFAHDRDLVRFSVKTAASGRQPGRPLNLVLLLDNSGSMERADRVRIRQECLRVLAGQLQPEDRVSVVAFARTPRLWVDGLSGAQAAELPGRVGELTPDGGTNLEEALRTAYQTAARHFAANGVNRVILLTDGAANLGDVQPDSLKQQVETNRQQGIALDCFGIGWEGLNDELLEVLSRNGDGRYGFVNTPEAAQSEFAGQLVGALQIAASDVKVQVEWNPKRVTAYRQLGYAKHQLKKEQFRDNTVDAAEIAAAEAGNALYTVQVNPAGEGPLGTVRVRFKVPGTSDYSEHEWPLHYDGTARPLDQAGPALRLAAGASAFSEWLVSSPWAAEVTPDRLLGLLNGVTDTYAADPRPKQFEQMLRQAKSVSGK